MYGKSALQKSKGARAGPAAVAEAEGEGRAPMMILSRLIAIGFLGSLFAMFRFSKYCRLLNCRDVEQGEAERYRARAQRWLAAAGCLLGVALLSILAGVVLQ